MRTSEYGLARVRRLLCVALVLCAVVCAQTVSLEEQSHQHSYQHCCGLCHTGPLAFVPMAIGAAVVSPSAIVWLALSDDVGGVLERLSSTESSRAPPA